MVVDLLGADEGCALTTNGTKTARREGAGNSGLQPAPSAALSAGERGLRESPVWGNTWNSAHRGPLFVLGNKQPWV